VLRKQYIDVRRPTVGQNRRRDVRGVRGAGRGPFVCPLSNGYSKLFESSVFYTSTDIKICGLVYLTILCFAENK